MVWQFVDHICVFLSFSTLRTGDSEFAAHSRNNVAESANVWRLYYPLVSFVFEIICVSLEHWTDCSATASSK